MLTPQFIRAEAGSTVRMELRLPVSENDQRARRVTVGRNVLEVRITDEDQRRGFAKIHAAVFWRCTEPGLELEGAGAFATSS